MGSKNTPFYRIVVADERSPVKGKVIESIGWYDPKCAKDNMKIDLAKVDAWIGKGAQMSDTVRSLVKKARLARPVVTLATGAGIDAEPVVDSEETPEETVEVVVEEVVVEESKENVPE